jgi:hypothetical protein
MMTNLRTLGAITALSALGFLIGAPAAFAGSGVPYTDPSAVGSIGLCDKAGQQITHGSLNATPFVWRAVSSQPAQAPYSDSGRTAVLYAFQPRQGIPPGAWSGEALTAAGRYTNSLHPMTAATRLDLSLKAFVEAFPAQWDGLVQLRMYLGAPGEQFYSLNYPVTNIKVTGNTWQIVGSAPAAACDSGKSVSVATLLLPKSILKPKHSSKTKANGSKSPAASPSSSSSAAAAAGATPGATSTPSLAANSSSTGSGTSKSWFVVVIIAALVAIGAVWSFIHSRSEKGR